MARYHAGDQVARRKHTWLPCAINEQITDETPAEEVVRIYRETYWSDYVTNGEWPALLDEDGVKAYVRSRLKKKLIGWWMVLGRVAALNPLLWNQAVDGAQRLYHQQIGECHPAFRTCCVCEHAVTDALQPDGGTQ